MPKKKTESGIELAEGEVLCTRCEKPKPVDVEECPVCGTREDEQP